MLHLLHAPRMDQDGAGSVESLKRAMHNRRPESATSGFFQVTPVSTRPRVRMVWWAVCIVGFIIGLVGVHVRQRLACSHNAPWAPGWLPIIGNSLQFLKHRNNFLDYVSRDIACVW